MYQSLTAVKKLKCKKLRYVGYMVIMVETRNAYRILMMKSLPKWPFGKLRRRLEEDIGLGHWEVGADDEKWMESFQDNFELQVLVSVVLNHQVRLPEG